VDSAGAVHDDGGTGVPAGSPLIEVAPDAPADAVMLKVDDPSISEFAVIDATVVADEYRSFTPQQASALLDSAEAAGVTLINQADEEATGGTPSP
jgi:hypothetical protein